MGVPLIDLVNGEPELLKRRLQYAAVPYRQRDDGTLGVMLVTSREPSGGGPKGLAHRRRQAARLGGA